MRRKAETLADLGNMPPALAETAPTRFAEMYGSANVQASRWFVTSVLLLLTTLALIAALIFMLPLRTVVPYMIQTDEVSGQLVGKPVAADEFKGQVTEKMVAAESRAFVRGLMTIDPFVTRANLERVATRVTGKASQEFKEFLAQERPFERLAKTSGLVRTADSIQVDASQKNIAFVFAQVSERISSGEPIVTRWRFTLHYAIDPAVDERGIQENPIGFVVTHFERVQEISK